MDLAKVFNLYGQSYIDKFGEKILPSHRVAMDNIIQCRTEKLGGHKRLCDCCNKVVYTYHSCKDRSCPKCGAKESNKWVKKQELKLLNTHYFHVTFTLPHELNDIIRSNQKAAYSILFTAAADTLKKVLKNNVFGNKLFGFMAVLHTWTRALLFHSHVHLLVPGGAWDKELGCWIPTPSSKFLVSERALSNVFRAIYVKKLRKTLPGIVVPEKVFAKDWVIKVLPALSHKKSVLEYLGRYVRKTAIINNRILSAENGNVTFKYQDSKTRLWKVMTLPGLQFISRFLQHVLPRGFTKIRHYGLLTPANKKYLKLAQESLLDETKDDESKDEKNNTEPKIFIVTCPHCKKGHLIIISEIKRGERAPP